MKSKEALLRDVVLPEDERIHLSVLQKAKQLDLHPNTVLRHVQPLGGIKVGTHWRFPYNTPGLDTATTTHYKGKQPCPLDDPEANTGTSLSRAVSNLLAPKSRKTLMRLRRS